jgi:phosphate transport system substrate-binding protein
MQNWKTLLLNTVLCSALVGLAGCGKGGGGGASGGGRPGQSVVVDGSDTMVNLSQAWAESYHKKKPDVNVQVSGGGSGVGINSLISGKVDMANASRRMDEKEIARAKTNFPGKEPKEMTLAIDALALYVHKDNPLDSISIEELAEIYGEGGALTKWSQLGIKIAGSDEIQRVSRQNNSGTYAYFREHVLGKNRDFKNGSIDQSGSKDVVTLVSRTPSAIGYSGMGYKTADVKWLKVSAKKGQPGVAPSVEAARNGTYPISRPLFVYTIGEPQGAVKDFLDWCHGPEGQAIVAEMGYVPLK